MKYSKLAQKHRVSLGFVVGMAFAYLSRPSMTLLGWGTILASIGLAVRFWAAGHLDKAKTLTTSGPYSYTRNPLYFGSFVLLIGFLIAGGNWTVGVVILLVFGLIYAPTMHREEAELRNGFQGKYDHYAVHVPLFFPRLTPYAGQKPYRSFRLSQVFRNREQGSQVGCVIGLLIIYLKIRFF